MATVKCGLAVQFALTTGGGVFTNVLTDIRAQERLVCSYGIRGFDLSDRVAGQGTLSFLLNNSEKNSAQTLGYYSLLNASKRVGFDLFMSVRLVLTYQELTYYKFRGHLKRAVPSPGKHEDRTVSCMAVDWMDDAARIDMPDIAAQTNKRGDELVTLILDAMSIPPVARNIEVGISTFAWALDGGTGQKLKVRERINQICQSEFSYAAVIGDEAQGGTFRWENRRHRAANPDVLTTLTANDLLRPDGIAVPGDLDDIYSKVQVTAHPTTLVGGAVLFSLGTTTTLLQPGETNDQLSGAYRDPATNDSVGGTDQVDPFPHTDYEMNSAQDGTGSDQTLNFTVIATFTGEGVKFLLANRGGTAAYVTKLQVRGTAVKRSSTDLVVRGGTFYGDNILELDMPFQSNTNVASDAAHFLSSTLGTLASRAPFVRFLANQNDRLMRAAIQREPGDRIAVSEDVTGLNGEFTINAVKLEITGEGWMFCTWTLEPATTTDFWVWPTLMGVSSVLGF